VPDVKTAGIDGAAGEDNSPADTRDLAGGCVHAWSVVGDDRAIGGAHKTVAHVVRVREGSGNIPCRVKSVWVCPLIGARAGTRSVDGGERAAGGVPQKAMNCVVRVHVDAGYIPGRVDGECGCPLIHARAGVRSLEGGDRTTGGAHKAMDEAVRVGIGSGDVPPASMATTAVPWLSLVEEPVMTTASKVVIAPPAERTKPCVLLFESM